MDASTIQLIALGIELAGKAAAGIQTAIEQRDLIKSIVAEDRDPTPEEWERLNTLFDGAVDRVLSA